MAQKIFDPSEKEKHGRHTKVAIVTTHWSEQGSRSYPKEEARCAELEAGLRADWIDKGRLFNKTDDTQDTARDIVRSLLRSEVKETPQKSKSFGFLKFFRGKKA
jgi:hypothetical protein